MADLLRASVDARPVLGLSGVRTLFLTSSFVSVPRGFLKFHGPRRRVCVSSSRKSVDCLQSRTTSPPPDASSSTAPESSPSPPDSQAGPTDFDVISTSECSDGSIVFRFGYATEMEKNVVQLEEGEISNADANEVASESLLPEESKRIAPLEMLHEDQQGAKLSGGSVNEVARESLSSKDTNGVVGLEKADSTKRVQLEEKVGPHDIEPTVDQPGIDDGSIAWEPSHHVSAESQELHESSEHTHLGLLKNDSFGPEISTNDINETSISPSTEPELDGTANLENSGGMGTDLDASSIPFQSKMAASLVEEAIDLEESSQPNAPEKVGSPANSDNENAISLEEESLEETSEEDAEDVYLEELPQANVLNDYTKAADEEEILPTRMEEEDITSASTNTDFDIVASSENLSQEHSEESIDVDHSNLPPALVHNEPELDILTVNLTIDDVEGAASFPASTLIESASFDDNKMDNSFEFLTAKEAVETGEESSKITEMSDISGDESECDSFISERDEILMSETCLSTGAVALPHPSKALTGGEDAYFIAGENWLGVADGAGHWSMEGTDTGFFAQDLMENCKAIVSNSVTNPLDVLVRSAAETESVGSSTALVAHLDGQVLQVANIGDTGFLIIRKGIIIERSSPKAHEFNFPVQIRKGNDPSEMAESYRIELYEDDVIVAATDGLFDNLHEQEIASVVLKSRQAGLSPQGIAEVLATRSQEVGRSSSARTPFADAAQAAGYVGFTSGKLDDATVIVALVKKSSSSSM